MKSGVYSYTRYGMRNSYRSRNTAARKAGLR